MSKTVDFGSLRILIIDDEVFMRRLIQRMLLDLGVSQITDAENGELGLANASKSNGKLDLVICDLEMPVLGGLKFIEHLRGGVAGEKNKDVAVVILTGHSDEDNLQKAVELGIQGYLVKPVSPAALEKRIRSSVGAPTIDPKLLVRNDD